MDTALTIKGAAKRLLLGSRTLRLAGHLVGSPRIVILGYHSIQERPEENADSIGLAITHSASAFDSQMDVVAREYTPVSLEDVRLILQGKRELRKNAVAITFDDGYRDNWDIANAILRRYGLPATFYLTTSWIDSGEPPWFCRLRYAFTTTRCSEWTSPADGRIWHLRGSAERSAALQAALDLASQMPCADRETAVRTVEKELDVPPLVNSRHLMMSWDQARGLHGLGHIIGSHTTTHPNVAHLMDELNVREEIAESKRKIEKELQSTVSHFSYPHPSSPPSVDTENNRDHERSRLPDRRHDVGGVC